MGSLMTDRELGLMDERRSNYEQLQGAKAVIAELKEEKFKLGNYISILQQGIEEAFMAGASNPYKAHFKLVKEAKKYANRVAGEEW